MAIPAMQVQFKVIDYNDHDQPHKKNNFEQSIGHSFSYGNSKNANQITHSGSGIHIGLIDQNQYNKDAE